ncbi:MAG: DNA polymerase III subunit alpha, partial [Caldilineae bacterium]
MLDGLARTKGLVAQAVAHQQPALALTDHGVMHGAIEFFRNCKSRGIKPIIGVEAYLTPYGRPMTARDPERDKVRHHLLLLAQNMTGYRNLLKICSAAQLEGYYYKPRIDADFLAAHSDGLICTSGCMAAEIPYLLNDENDRAPKPEQALQRLQWYLDVFGRDRFFIELQEHNIPSLTRINKTLFEWAKKYNLQMVVTNDVHYVRAEDARPHDTLLCVQTNSLTTDPKRMRMSDGSYYLKSEAEMRALFRPLADLPENAFTNTLKIAEMCQVDLEDPHYHLPDLPAEVIPPGYNYKTFLRKLTDEGLARRYGERASSPEIQARKEHELRIISRMNFDVYFLIVWDLCQYARRNNIWWNVRGSGAGSIVAYALGITKIDPLQNHLIFERFLNPGRVSMPDFDLDFPDDQREEMIRYTIRRYGEDHVAQIVAFGRMKARAAIRDVGRAQGVPLPEVDRIAKLIPAIPGKPVTIASTLDPESEFFSPELKTRYETEPAITELVDAARSLEGVARHASVHAAAVIVTDKPLVNYVPLMRPQGAVITKAVTQFEFPICESIGLLKVDFLGLSTLTIMRRAAELIKERHGIEYTLDNIPIEDPQAFRLLASGNLTGIFQVEGAGMRRVLTEMQPTKFDHIIAAISLYRPGPMENIPRYIARMHGREEVTYHHPDLAPILEDTYGIIVYQEQIIRIATELAGYEPGEADMIRKAVAKKKKDLMEKHRQQFTQGAMQRGYSREVCEKIWGDIEFFARYGFNKAHAADYAAITCQTAFLKAHYPVEYMTALLTVEQHNTDKIGMLMDECRAMGIEVLPPDINRSHAGFVIEETDGRQAIRFGLGAVKNVGDGPIETILEARGETPFADVDDFCQRVDLRKVGKRALESLIKVGALKDFGDRPLMLALMERMLRLSAQTHRAAAEGQISMFDLANFDIPVTGSIMTPPPKVEEYSRKEMLGWEKELVGTYLSSHPIQPHMETIRQVATHLCGEVHGVPHGQQVRVAGLITRLRQTTTKKGDAMAFLTIEDTQGALEVVVFPRTYAAARHLLLPDSLILVTGKVDAQEEDRPKILADAITNELTIPRPAGEDQNAPPPPPVPYT